MANQRSLTPNPRLNEIAAAVRNLQGAIQEDTGIPTGQSCNVSNMLPQPLERALSNRSLCGVQGSPPSQPLKPLIATCDKESFDPDSIHRPTPQKCVSKCKNVGKKVSRRKNPFSVYIDVNDDANHFLQNKEPEVVSNVNIRSTLGPVSTQKTTNSAKSKKSFNTRQTRSSRRAMPKNHLEESRDGTTVNEELLHMIDTLPFQPFSKGDSTSQAMDETSMADETQQDHILPANHGSSQLAESECLVDRQITDCKRRSQITFGQPTRVACSTTIAEADSSMKPSPCDNSFFIENGVSFSPTLTSVPTNGDYKGDEGEVSSTKFECCSPCSLDTKQSVSILPSQDCHEQQCNTSVDEIQGTNQRESSPKREESLFDGVTESEVVKTENSARRAQEGPLLTCKGRKNNDNLSPQSSKRGLSSERLPSCSKNRVQESLDFEGLVSLFDDPLTSEDGEKLPKADDNSKKHPDARQHEEETFPLTEKSSAHCEESQNQATESDLCERVKMRRRRRTSEFSLPSSKRSEASKKSLQLKTKTKKRYVESAATLTSDGDRFSGNTRKKLKQVEDPLVNKKSPIEEGEAKELREDREKKEEMHTNRMILQSVKHDEQAQDGSKCGSDSGKTVLSSEIIQASVSSSDISPTTVINPMIAHVDQGEENSRRGMETQGSISQRNMENNQREVTALNSVIVSTLTENAESTESPEIKLISDRNKENLTNLETQDQENDYQHRETRNEKRKFHEEDANWSGSKPEVLEIRHHQYQTFYPNEMTPTASGNQGLPLQKGAEEHEPDLVKTSDSPNSLLEAECEHEDHLRCSFTWNSHGDTVTEMKEIVEGCNGQLLNETEHLTPQKSSQKGQIADDTPTESSLEFLDAMTPCLFVNDGLKMGDQSSPSNAADFRTSTFSMGKTEEENSLDVQNDGCHGENSRDGIKVEHGNDDREKDVDLARCSEGVGEILSNTDGTQSFETSQSISVLHGLEFPPHDQSQDSTNCSETIPDLGRSSKHFQKQSEEDASWAEPFPKKTRKIEVISTSQDDTCPDLSRKLGSGTRIKKNRDSECVESEVIPPTPPVKPVPKHALGNQNQSPSKLSHPNANLQKNDAVRSRLEHPVVKRSRRSKSPRVSQSATSSSTRSSANSEQSESCTSLLKNLETIVPDLSKEFESSQGRKPGTAVTEWNATPSQSPEEFEMNKNLSDKTSSDRCFSQDKTFSQSSHNKIRSDVLNSKERTCKNLGDMPCPDAAKSNSSPQTSTLDKKHVHGDVEDSFSWTGTKDKRNSQISPFPSYDDIADKNIEDVGDVFKNKLGEANVRVSGEQDCFHGDYDERDISHRVDRRRKSPYSIMDEGNALVSDNEGDSSSDEVLLKPVFLPKPSESDPNDKSGEEDEDDEEELQSFSQELIPSDEDREDEDDDGIYSCKALDSTGASSATVLSEAAASTQKMEVLRQDVEAMEREMDELRAYLAKTDEQQKEENMAMDDDMDCMEEDPRDCATIASSLTPPPPLTPKSIPPMRQLSSPLKKASRYLNQEGQSSDEDGDEDIDGEDITTSNRRENCTLISTPCNGKDSLKKKEDAVKSCSRKRPLSPSYEDDGLSITEVENRYDKTPSPPRSSRTSQKSQERDEDLIVIDDRDTVNSKKGSLLLVKRRKVVDELVPRKSPVVSLLFTRTVKDVNTASQSPISHGLAKGLSPSNKRSPFIYSRKRAAEAPTICVRSSKVLVSPETASRDDRPRDRARGGTCDARSQETASGDSVSAGGLLTEGVTRAQGQVSDKTFIELSTASNTPESPRNRKKDNSGSEMTKPPSFVATRLNRKQLADARVLAETYGGKLASEFNSKTTHVIMATDENMQVTRHSYTMKYLLGLALGKWIVSHHWITACVAAKTLVAEADYEVKGDADLGQSSIPCLARTARSNKEALLFEDFHVLCFGKFGAAVAKGERRQARGESEVRVM
ncbi:Breast cancer type 1 susceptibility protein-like [Stylophora pistillata]|uniref:Breast cancer type 1 susceptibility protein-like n=1 Tax=Stylophora pistillata TaxID=50429 RepID=A0A2B4SM42_STYPI|nr:Breast cancer type 1 susceptibility protein-like [Stylophora pistillata]